MKSKIVVRYEFRTLHKYENAPESVSFLRNIHRHKFEVEVKISVTHNDRELEFIIVQHHLAAVVENMCNFNADVADWSMSCEQMAEYIIGQLQAEYGDDRFYECSVFEDGENGAIVCTE